MAKCKKTKKLFEKALYNELKTEEAIIFKTHLENCNSCRKEYSELEETLQLFNSRVKEEANPQFLENLWDNIEPELETGNKRNIWFQSFSKNLKGLFFLETTWSKQLVAGMALLVIGVFIGKYILETETRTNSIENSLTNNQQVIQTSVQEKTDRYINRSKVLLLGLLNYDPTSENIDAINLPKHKEISKSLITEAAELKDKLSAPSQRKLRELISDLEVVLLQIANLELEYDLSGIDLVKSGVDKRGIFLKINLQKIQQSNSIQEEQSLEKIDENI